MRTRLVLLPATIVFILGTALGARGQAAKGKTMFVMHGGAGTIK